MTVRESSWQLEQKRFERGSKSKLQRMNGARLNGARQSHPLRTKMADWSFRRFKLHLRSKHNPSNNRVAAEIPPLPPGKTVVQVFGDFLKYLMECTTTYINDTHPNSQELWDSIKGNVSYVLSHPNGWEGLEQSQMRQAAVAAKIIDNTPAGHAKLSFVTEGEASLHFAIEHGVLSEALKPGDGIVVVDAGGGTVDVSAYKQTKTSSGGTVLEEIVAPECFFQGSVFVTLRARMFLQCMSFCSP